MSVTLTAEQLAELIPCPLSSLYRHAKRKEADPDYSFPQPYRLGPRMLRFRSDDVDEWLSRRQPATSDAA